MTITNMREIKSIKQTNTNRMNKSNNNELYKERTKILIYIFQFCFIILFHETTIYLTMKTNYDKNITEISIVY